MCKNFTDKVLLLIALTWAWDKWFVFGTMIDIGILYWALR